MGAARGELAPACDTRSRSSGCQRTRSWVRPECCASSSRLHASQPVFCSTALTLWHFLLDAMETAGSKVLPVYDVRSCSSGCRWSLVLPECCAVSFHAFTLCPLFYSDYILTLQRLTFDLARVPTGTEMGATCMLHDMVLCRSFSALSLLYCSKLALQ